MTYTLPTRIVELDLVCELRKVLNDPKYNCLSNEGKSQVLLELENDGEYDPLD